MTTSHATLVTKACASASTMNRIMVARNITRRPMLVGSQPPSIAPTSAPPCVPAPARPSSQRVGMILVA